MYATSTGFVAASFSSAPVSTNGASGANSYNTWQWGGFSRIASAAPTDSDANNDLPETLFSSSVSLSQLAAESDADAATTALSGYVYYDENGNGLMETTDWGVIDVEIALTKEGDSDPFMTTYTNTTGKYSFVDLPPGTYSIALLTPTSDPPQLTLGKLFDSDGFPVADAGQIVDGAFRDIKLEDGYQGINYVFCLSDYPVAAVSKRLLIDGFPEHSLPEPATVLLLATAGLVLGTYSRRRHCS
ncbi:MAG: PEP-CTERM sorting domain-containing protein [Pirellulales bacterium]|nr:PEP-CTERM sorting domain-containing protein [Pirellulales bacterium]